MALRLYGLRLCGCVASLLKGIVVVLVVTAVVFLLQIVVDDVVVAACLHLPFSPTPFLLSSVSSSFEALRLYGSAALWQCGFVALILCDNATLWFCAVVVLWPRCFMALWLVASLLYGFVDIPVVDAVVFGLLFFCLAFMFFYYRC